MDNFFSIPFFITVLLLLSVLSFIFSASETSIISLSKIRLRHMVSRGIKRAQAWHGNAGMVEVRAPTIDVVDTIGAGDSFQAALLFALRALGRISAEALIEMNSDELHRALSVASICAAFTCGRPGADPPRANDVSMELSRLLPNRV